MSGMHWGATYLKIRGEEFERKLFGIPAQGGGPEEEPFCMKSQAAVRGSQGKFLYQLLLKQREKRRLLWRSVENRVGPEEIAEEGADALQKGERGG